MIKQLTMTRRSGLTKQIALLAVPLVLQNLSQTLLMSVSFTMGIAVNMATSSLVAQYLGAGQPSTAERVVYRDCVLAMGLAPGLWRCKALKKVPRTWAVPVAKIDIG